LIYLDLLVLEWGLLGCFGASGQGNGRENAQKTHNRNQAGVRILSAGGRADLPRQSHATASLQIVKDQGA